MKTEQRKSGLIVPKQKPPTPTHTYNALEIQDEDKRKRAKEALSQLCDAMDLPRGGGCAIGPEASIHNHRRDFYCFFAKMLLGKDYPDFEELC